MTLEERFSIIEDETVLALVTCRKTLEEVGESETMQAFVLQPAPQYGSIYFSFLTVDEPDLEPKNPPTYQDACDAIGNWRYSSF